VLLFGRLADVAGWRERDFEAESVSALKAALSAEGPAVAEALSGAGVNAAVNQRIVLGDAPLTTGDEVAFLPPMSGG
jgi:molybdopterin synthase sulfur carrier subunit